MKNVPLKIYLDLGQEPDEEDDFKDLEEVTWSEDNATNNGLLYYYAPAVEGLVRAAQGLANKPSLINMKILLTCLEAFEK